MGPRKLLMGFAVLLLACTAGAQDRAWIAESDRQAQVLLELIARYSPESAASLGVEGHDEEIFDLKPQFSERQEADLQAAVQKLQAARASATDPRVRQDIDILIKSANDQRNTLELNRRLMLPYFDLGRAIFQGFQNQLHERIPKERQAAALVRLRRYAGTEKGYEPITMLARARFEEAMKNDKLVGPWTVEVEDHLANLDRYVKGIGDLLQKSGLKGWRKDYDAFAKQMKDYGEWVRTTVMPRARKDNRLPPEIYADNLKNFGVDADPRQLMNQALFAFLVTRDEMDVVAATVAEQRNWKDEDYRAVIRRLKQETIPNDKLLPTYQARLKVMEDIVTSEKIVSLPKRDAVIRLGTEAESAAQPAPHIDLPRLIGNTGEPAEFVLPLSNPTSKETMDDFTNDAITWSLTAHEARPGHELQLASMIEQGVSTARAIFAFNSANVEGWGLYAEAIMKKYYPPEGQLGALQMRLMRAARAFLDPMLNLGMIEPAAAKRLLMEEVVLSEPMAKQEVDRYTFRAPGQATAYFYGYTRLDALRTRVEIALEDRFSEQAFHDYIVNQGLLPLDLLEKSVMEDFVPSQRSAQAAAQ